MMYFKFEQSYMVTTRGSDFEVVGLQVGAPTAKSRVSCSVLESEFNTSQIKAMKAIKDIADSISDEEKEAAKTKDKDSDKMDAETALSTMSMGGADMCKCYGALDQILKDSGANVELENGSFEKATSDFTIRMPYQDQKRLLGEYIANFIVT